MVFSPKHRRLDTLAARAQPDTGVTYASKINKAEAALDFRRSARALERKVRAVDPQPGASATYRSIAIKIWGARLGADAAACDPGRILKADADGIVVGCGDGTLVLTQLQRPGARRMAARDFLQGFALVPQTGFDLPPALET